MWVLFSRWTRKVDTAGGFTHDDNVSSSMGEAYRGVVSRYKSLASWLIGSGQLVGPLRRLNTREAEHEVCLAPSLPPADSPSSPRPSFESRSEGEGTRSNPPCVPRSVPVAIGHSADIKRAKIVHGRSRRGRGLSILVHMPSCALFVPL